MADPANSDEMASQGFAELLGTQWVSLDPDDARATIEISERHLQPYGIVHGGVYAALAESLTSAATYNAVKDDGMVAMGMSNDTSFLRPVREGTIKAIARARSPGPHDLGLGGRGDSTTRSSVCALCRVTIAVRPMRR